MPFALVLIGLIMVVTAAKGTHVALGTQLTKDFTGPGNFIYWFVAIGVVGAVGQIPKGEKLANPFLVLLIAAMLLAQSRNGRAGFFKGFMDAIKQGPVASPRESTTGATASAGSSQQAGSAAPVGDLVKMAAQIAPFLL
jgi:hypothetical protein